MNNYYYGTVEHKSDLKTSIIIMHISNKTVHVIDLCMNNCMYKQLIKIMTVSILYEAIKHTVSYFSSDRHPGLLSLLFLHNVKYLSHQCVHVDQKE